MAYGIIYKITNKLNGMTYVGQTTRSLEVRFKEHTKADSLIGDAIRKYGEENFSREIIEECKSSKQLYKREMFWIAYFNCKAPNGYNQTDGGESGWTHTPETRAKMSESHTGTHLTAESRSKIATAQLGNKNSLGHRHTAESRTKMSKVNKGIPKIPRTLCKSF